MKTRECIDALRCMAQTHGKFRVQTKLLIKALCHSYFLQPTFACLK